MKIKIYGVELHRIVLPLVAPFRTSCGVETCRDALLVRVVTSDGIEGWAECAAMSQPRYCSEYVDGAQDVLHRHLVPALPKDGVDTATVGRARARARKAAATTGGIAIDTRARLGHTAPLGTTDESRIRHLTVALPRITPNGCSPPASEAPANASSKRSPPTHSKTSTSRTAAAPDPWKKSRKGLKGSGAAGRLPPESRPLIAASSVS